VNSLSRDWLQITDGRDASRIGVEADGTTNRIRARPIEDKCVGQQCARYRTRRLAAAGAQACCRNN